MNDESWLPEMPRLGRPPQTWLVRLPQTCTMAEAVDLLARERHRAIGEGRLSDLRIAAGSTLSDAPVRVDLPNFDPYGPTSQPVAVHTRPHVLVPGDQLLGVPVALDDPPAGQQ